MDQPHDPGQAREPTSAPRDLKELRRRRQEDLLVQALETPDALTANLGAVLAEMIDFSYCTKEQLNATLAAAPAQPDSILISMMDRHLRGVRLVDRLGRLSLSVRSQDKFRQEPG